MKKLSVTLCALVFPLLAIGAKYDIRFGLNAPESVPENATFSVGFVLENAQGANFRGPVFKGCRVLQGPEPSRSSNLSVRDGIFLRTETVTYRYILVADGKKPVRIGSATVEVDGKRYKSAPATIKIEREKNRKTGGKISFEAEYPSTVEIGEAFKINFWLKNAGGGNFTLPSPKNFEVVYGPEITDRSLFWSGDNAFVCYTVVLKAEKEGRLTVPAATIDVNGKVYKTKKLKLKVLPLSKPSREKKFREAQRRYQSI